MTCEKRRSRLCDVPTLMSVDSVSKHHLAASASPEGITSGGGRTQDTELIDFYHPSNILGLPTDTPESDCATEAATRTCGCNTVYLTWNHFPRSWGEREREGELWVNVTLLGCVAREQNGTIVVSSKARLERPSAGTGSRGSCGSETTDMKLSRSP